LVVPGVTGPTASALATSARRPLRPPLLQPGDRVCVVSPASPPDPELVEAGERVLSSWGLVVQRGAHIFDHFGYLAGTDRDRLADLNAALRDPTCRAVIATRGGYGVQRIVDGIDFGAVQRDPKPVVGFSDITALLMELWNRTRLVTIHGPMVQLLDERTAPVSAASLQDALMTTKPISLTSDTREPSAAAGRPGRASGVLLGGNLTLLASSVGTESIPDLRGAIVLIEEVGEPPYRIDRMLTQLRRAGALDGIAGVALGQFTDILTSTVAGADFSLDEVLRDRLGDLGVPILGGLAVGHGNEQFTVPFGVRATLDTHAGTLTMSAGVAAAGGQSPAAPPPRVTG